MFRALPLLLILLIPFTVHAASFDCAKAAHPLEKIICGDANLSRLDEDVANTYKDKRAQLFDKNALRAMQNNWQQILRTRCETECSLPEVTADYETQLQSLKTLNDEIYDANYKTNDIATLNITHLGEGQFAFIVTREYLDDGKKLCALPADDSEAEPTARMTGEDAAESEGGGCKLKFKFKREKETGSVVEIEMTGNDECKPYCPNGEFLLDDRYIPENGWVPGNQ